MLGTRIDTHTDITRRYCYYYLIELSCSFSVFFFLDSCQLGNLAIVTEYLAKGSVSDLLKDKKNPVAFKRRMLWAKDCAMGILFYRCVFVQYNKNIFTPGMSWLHGASPPILHLDLKTANLLIDDQWHAKV